MFINDKCDNKVADGGGGNYREAKWGRKDLNSDNISKCKKH